MPDQVIYSQPFGTVLVDASVPCLLTQWHRFANATDYVALLEAALTYFEAHSTPARPWGWVADVRQMGAIPARAETWLLSDFNPRVAAAGLRELSALVAENIFGQIASQRYIKHTAQAHDQYALHTTYYDSLEAAKAGAKAALQQPGSEGAGG